MKSVLGILLLLIAHVQAIPVTYEFTGTISDVDVFGIPDPGITRSSAFSLLINYDTSAPDQLEQTDLGRYAASGFTFTCNGLEFASAGGRLDVWVQDTLFENQPDQLVFIYPFNSITAPWGNSFASLDLTLNDSTRSIFQSDSLPSNLDLSQWDSLSFVFAGSSGGPDHYIFGGIITGIVRVPDFGGTGLLLLLSSALLIAINHRRSSRSASL